jgi:HK97 family phage portal protein
MSVLGTILGDGVNIADLRNPRLWDGVGQFHRKTTSGQSVSAETALTLDAYFAVQKVISEDVGKTPIKVYRKLDRGKELLPNHPVQWLLHDEPNPEMVPQKFIELLAHWASGWGRGPAEIQRDANGYPAALWPIHPSRVRPTRFEGALLYDVINDDHTWVRLPASDVIDVIGWGTIDAGYGMLRYAAESIGQGLAAKEFGAAFFGNGAMPGIVITHPGKLSDEATERMRQSWRQIYGSNNAHTPAILEQGVKAERLSIAPDEAQFIDTQQVTVEALCRFARVALSKVHSRQHQYKDSVEQENINHINDTMVPWYNRFEQEFNRKLLTRAERKSGIYTKFVIKAWLIGDMQARSQFYRERFNIGTLSQNDIRELEDENPIGPEGDTYYVALNMGPSEQTSLGDNASRAGRPGVDNNSRKVNQSRSPRTEAIVTVQAKVAAGLLATAFRRQERAVNRAAEKAADRDAFALASAKFWMDERALLAEMLGPVVDATTALLAAEYGETASTECAAEALGMFVGVLTEDLGNEALRSYGLRPFAHADGLDRLAALSLMMRLHKAVFAETRSEHDN